MIRFFTSLRMTNIPNPQLRHSLIGEEGVAFDNSFRRLLRLFFMKIELIVPAVEENARVPNLALPILAALSPPDVQISLTDDLLTPIRLDKDLKEIDLVGITVLTKTALRAYDIADAYRRKGIPVVLGGIHPTAVPEEANEHADSVVLGEAEEVWPRLVEDARTGDLKPFYRQEGYTDLSRMPTPRRDILPSKGYLPLDVLSDANSVPFRNSLEKLIGSDPSPTWSRRFAISLTGG
jgi:radical SAM superfamily enzyme YgiQ (UPF0313 family)